MEPAELPPLPGGWERRPVTLGSQTFSLWLPKDPDSLLDDEAVQERNRREDYMPYWAWLWDAAETFGRLVLERSWQGHTRALELGSGVGVVGLAGLAAGLQITFSDVDATSVEVALRNARDHGFPEAQGWTLDWRAMDAAPRERFSLILACDVMYESQLHSPLLDAIERFLEPGGEAWIADPGRDRAPAFCERAAARGWSIQTRDSNGAPLRGPRGGPDLPLNAFRLLVLRRPTAARQPV